MICNGATTDTVGNPPLANTDAVVAFVHPLMALVAVSVYVPAEFTVAGFAAFSNAPPFHVSILPALVPVKVAVVFAQVKLLLAIADVITGKVVLVVTDTTVVVTHPFATLVDVNV